MGRERGGAGVEGLSLQEKVNSRTLVRVLVGGYIRRSWKVHRVPLPKMRAGTLGVAGKYILYPRRNETWARGP